MRFGVVTNAELPFQRAKMDATGLASRIELTIASGDVGVAKPHPRIFEYACERFGVAPADAAHVGDRLDTDAIGAARAGLTGVWLDRKGTATGDEVARAEASGVRIIARLDDLPTALSIQA